MISKNQKGVLISPKTVIKKMEEEKKRNLSKISIRRKNVFLNDLSKITEVSTFVFIKNSRMMHINLVYVYIKLGIIQI